MLSCWLFIYLFIFGYDDRNGMHPHVMLNHSKANHMIVGPHLISVSTPNELVWFFIPNQSSSPNSCTYAKSSWRLPWVNFNLNRLFTCLSCPASFIGKVMKPHRGIYYTACSVMYFTSIYCNEGIKLGQISQVWSSWNLVPPWTYKGAFFLTHEGAYIDTRNTNVPFHNLIFYYLISLGTLLPHNWTWFHPTPSFIDVPTNPCVACGTLTQEPTISFCQNWWGHITCVYGLCFVSPTKRKRGGGIFIDFSGNLTHKQPIEIKVW